MELTADIVRALLPERPADGHKGNFGHVYIIAGARGFFGAAKLATEGALRSGVGLATLSVPFPLGDAAAVSLIEAMTLRLPATDSETFSQDAFERALAFVKDKQAAAIGPGVTRHPETVGFVLDFVQACPVPLVVDADGLNALSEKPGALGERRAPSVVTPHPGEMARLTGRTTAEVQADRKSAALEFAREHHCVVVLKGHGTVVAAPDGSHAVNATGNVGLGKGGSGDVLTGLVAGLLAQGCAPFDAARLGVYVHGLAGDLAAARMGGRAMLARDVLEAVGAAFLKLEANA